MPYSAKISQEQDEHYVYVIMKTYMLLLSFCFCEIWALCVSWIICDRLYYTPSLACWTLFGSLVPAMCNRKLCAQVHELLQSHCVDNRGSHCFHDNIYIKDIYIYIYIYLYIYIYIYIFIYINTIKLFLSLITLIECSIWCTIEWFNWITVKIQLSFKYSEFHVNYFTIFSLITTLDKIEASF